MGGFKEKLQYFERLSEEDERTEKKREAASAKRRELREMQLMEEQLAFIDSSTIPFTMGGVKEKLQYFKRLSEEDERQDLSSREPRPNLSRHHLRHHHHLFPRYKSNPEKERAGSPASSSGSMMSARSMDFPLDFKRHHLRHHHHLFPSERSFGFRAEKIRAGSPALSCGSMMSNRSMEYSKGLLMAF